MPHRPLLLVLPVLLLLLTMPSAAAASPPVAAIAAQVDAEAAHSGLPGFAVTVTRGTSLLCAGGRGVDHAGAPMTATTPLSLASLSKSFTAVAAVRLAARGEIALDRPVVAQLAEFDTADPRGALITPRHLLTQTSGLTDATAHAEAIDNAWDPAGAVARLHSATLAAGPGARFAYTNANYEVIARLLEVAGGAPFAEILRREVFAPLGMVDTRVGARTDTQPGAVSVLGVWAPRTWPASLLSSGGAAGVVSTARDMGRWFGFQNGDGAPLLSARDLTSMHVPGDPRRTYAMGWIVDDATADHPVLGHTGSMLTRSSAQIIDPRTGIGVAVATESASMSDDTYEMARRLYATAAGAPVDPPPPVRQIVDGVLAGASLLAAILGALGVARARRWSERRASSRRWTVVLRLLPSAAALAVMLGLPWIGGVLFGRTLTWAVLFTFLASVTTLVVVAGTAGAVTLVARVAALRRIARLGSGS